MKLVMTRATVLACVSIALLHASCKKNEEIIQPPAATGHDAAAFKAPGAFKKEIPLNDAGGKNTFTLLISGNDEEAVKKITREQFRITTGNQQPVTGNQSQQGASAAAAIAPADENKVIYIGIRSAATSPADRVILQPLPYLALYIHTDEVGHLKNPIRFYTDDFGRGLLLRKQTLSSNNYFGVSTHFKVIGLIVQPFGGPVGTPGAVYGNTGWPITSSGTSPAGIYCNMLLTELTRTNVKYQAFVFSAAARPL